MRLIHYSTDPFTGPLIDTTFQEVSHKPRGLWVSVEGPDDWKSWCESEGFRLESLAHENEVALADSARILFIHGPLEIDAFTSEYRAAVPEWNHRSIDWPLVASRYDGIIIAPYCFERRLEGHTSWYYSWDCASGCIWNTGAVKSIFPVRDGCAITSFAGTIAAHFAGNFTLPSQGSPDGETPQAEK